jgi:hypothetical protein
VDKATLGGHYAKKETSADVFIEYITVIRCCLNEQAPE